MAVEKSYARLGLFIVVVLVVVLATAVLFIQRMRSRDVIGMVTYTTENVRGLDVSSPVLFRGVHIGQVTELRVDAQGTIVEIDFEVFLDRLNTVGLDVTRIRTITDIGGTFPRLRARTVANPVTGEAYLLLDVPQNPPPPMDLGFTPSRPYVPSMPSTFQTVQDRLPALLDRAEATLQTLKEIVARVPDSLDRSDRFFTNVERIVQDSDLPALSADSRKFFATTTTQIEQIRSELDGVIGTEGTLVKFSEEARAAIKGADFPAVNQSAREAAENSRLAADDLRRSLPAIQDSLEEMRDLARLLEDQPESVVHGLRPAKVKR
ncbi:MlaD family protein [Edaphobacter aggregans]|uniref:MlaD family protein n=1 Tax=Edaphobacter aggregans TaxID=570835 RepID=UPI0005594D99|nr:MlaD family protein [Edaphobacter aggregans]